MVSVAKPHSTPRGRLAHPFPFPCGQLGPALQETRHRAPLLVPNTAPAPDGSQTGARDGTGWKEGEKKKG